MSDRVYRKCCICKNDVDVTERFNRLEAVYGYESTGMVTRRESKVICDECMEKVGDMSIDEIQELIDDE